MSLNVNHVILAGNLTRDPELRTLAADRAVANFALAVNRRFKGPEGDLKDEVTFIEVEAWGRTAEVVGQYLTKGSPCYLEGRLKLDTWTDKDNQKRTRIKVVAETVQFLSRAPRPGETAGSESDPDAQAQAPAMASARPTATPARGMGAGKPRAGSGGNVATGVIDEPPF